MKRLIFAGIDFVTEVLAVVLLITGCVDWAMNGQSYGSSIMLTQGLLFLHLSRHNRKYAKNTAKDSNTHSATG